MFKKAFGILILFIWFYISFLIVYFLLISLDYFYTDKFIFNMEILYTLLYKSGLATFLWILIGNLSKKLGVNVDKR
ncbi:hypothetical protein IO48_02695 [Gallibacterium anatis 4895]|uniref:Uncharacterized protein n=1 Tax=Gallibacterium anatis 4895 TaxID=1396510 RepID=A0A0A3A7S5_9PAST|nr:hypothetical protein IO48_02695 [Gallibacterium anatis 4895]